MKKLILIFTLVLSLADVALAKNKGNCIQGEILCLKTKHKFDGPVFSLKARMPWKLATLKVIFNLTLSGTAELIAPKIPYTQTDDGTYQFEINFRNKKTSHLKKLLQISKGNNDWKYRWHVSLYTGKENAKHDDSFIYQLPISSGHRSKIIQGYNGSFSHSGATSNSLDFEVSEGTQIIAARGGIVIGAYDQYSKGGDDPRYLGKDNFVRILHSDGSVGTYSHLQKDGVLVEIGEKIEKGQLIALSGNTGFTTTPHLHFHVAVPFKGKGQLRAYDTDKTLFMTESGAIFLEESKSYTAP